MPITHVGSAEKRQDPNFNVPLPAGCQAGDLAVFLVRINGIGTNVTFPEATRVAWSTSNNEHISQSWYKILTSTDVANGVLVGTDTHISSSICSVFRGVSSTSPVVSTLGNRVIENAVYSNSPDRAYHTVPSLGGDRPANHLEVLQTFSFKLPSTQSVYTTTSGFNQLYSTAVDFLEQPIHGVYTRSSSPSPTGATEFEITNDGTSGGASAFSSRMILREENRVPNVPTGLTVTSDVLDTTPNFSANISDPDTGQQIKGRFQLYQNDGTTLIGTVDSAFRAGDGAVTAEYASALAPGNYKVQAATVDDLGLISAYTSQVAFSVKTTVEKDNQYIWNVDTLITKELNVQWNVLTANEKEIQFLWGVTTPVETSIEFSWDIYPIWTLVDSDPEAPVNWEEAVT